MKSFDDFEIVRHAASCQEDRASQEESCNTLHFLAERSKMSHAL
jgi:hypothetical protein